ncbi:AGRG1 protein, partial [Calcarius ornatus]|nr:AGRG1 protein [Calcarius ornatus]
LQLICCSVCLCHAGLGARGHGEEDFRFCGDRNQTQESSAIFQHGPATISIENTAQALIIKRPFLPSRRNSYYKYTLPPTLGRYRFCIFWFESNRSLQLVYGKQSIPLGGDTSSSVPWGQESQKTERTRANIFNVSYIIKGGKNTSLDAKAEYFFPASPESMPVWEQDVEEQLSTLASLLAQPLAAAPGAREQQRLRRKLGQLERMLAKVELEGQNQTFGEATVHATVLRVQPSRAPQPLTFAALREESGEVQGFTVDLPGSLFMMVKEREEVVEHRVLVMDINRQTMFQDENSSHVLGDKVVSISLVDTVVANLSEPVLLTFFHDQLPRNVTPLCVFWQENASGSSGSWDSSGCTTVTGSSQTQCRCNHLTYFAVLMAVCTAGGLFLHFSLLSCLTWMGIEGYNLYRLVIEVFNAYHDQLLLKLCLAGWGLPIFCVVTILLASWTNYGPVSIPIYESMDGRTTNATICWITSPLVHNTVNLGFFSLVFLFNSVMLGAMVREILRQNKKGHKLRHVLALLGLSILLGIPWALIFFSFTSGVFCLVSLYIFTIINSLQG